MYSLRIALAFVIIAMSYFNEIVSIKLKGEHMPNNQTDQLNQCDTWADWDNLIQYIKLNLGADNQSFEFDDEKILEIIKEHTMAEFSRYSPNERYFKLTSDDLISSHPSFMYQFKNTGKILKVQEVIPTGNMTAVDQIQIQSQNLGGDITDYLMSVNMLHMSQIAQAPSTWSFRAPDKLIVQRSDANLNYTRGFIVKLAIAHTDPTTIDPDGYEFLRDLALADIMIFIGRLRSKFKDLSTPYGQIMNNSDELLQEGKQLRQETIELLRNRPPEDFIFFLN